MLMKSMWDSTCNCLCAQVRNTAKMNHVILCKVDHFEPFNGKVNSEVASSRVKQWALSYPSCAFKHRDGDGIHPQHTWFYPPHHDIVFLPEIVALAKRGFGDVEMHLHHNRMEPFPDTSETLRAKIQKCILNYSKYGIFCLPDGSKRFAFIHGDWSLDNSRGPEYCGINDEISILKECGCYADFTFPSLGDAQPSKINSIYYCEDDQKMPKSYNSGYAVKVGGNPRGDFMMIHGIIGLRWKSRIHRFRPSLEDSNLGERDLPTPARIDFLVNNAVTIKGRPEWKFIKLHTHGAPEHNWDANFGKSADAMYSWLESKYNDGKKFKLHYVTAREMYNIIKAAEAGKSGDPNQYRNFEIPPYCYK